MAISFLFQLEIVAYLVFFSNSTISAKSIEVNINNHALPKPYLKGNAISLNLVIAAENSA